MHRALNHTVLSTNFIDFTVFIFLCRTLNIWRINTVGKFISLMKV